MGGQVIWAGPSKKVPIGWDKWGSCTIWCHRKDVEYLAGRDDVEFDGQDALGSDSYVIGIHAQQLAPGFHGEMKIQYTPTGFLLIPVGKNCSDL